MSQASSEYSDSAVWSGGSRPDISAQQGDPNFSDWTSHDTGIGTSSTIARDPNDLTGAAYDARAWAKQYVSRVAMHLHHHHRQRLFTQLDRLHDVDEWSEGDKPLRPTSFVSFIRAILVLRPKRWPSLGMTHEGHLIASWGGALDHLSIQFMAHDAAYWSLSYQLPDGGMEHAVGDGAIQNLARLLAPYQPDHWLRG